MYPEYAEAKPELAAFFGVAESELLFTNGTDEAIQVLINTYVDDGDDVLILRPSYAMYRFYAEVAGRCGPRSRLSPPTSHFRWKKSSPAIHPDTRAILIANPNNPTGTGIDVAGIQQILEAAPRRRGADR